MSTLLAPDVYLMSEKFQVVNGSRQVWHIKVFLRNQVQITLESWALVVSFETMTFVIASAVDPCLFFGAGTFIADYVYDLPIAGTYSTTIKNVHAAFSVKFKMKHLGFAFMFLGVNVSYGSGEVELSMKNFITKTAKSTTL